MAYPCLATFDTGYLLYELLTISSTKSCLRGAVFELSLLATYYIGGGCT